MLLQMSCINHVCMSFVHHSPSLYIYMQVFVDVAKLYKCFVGLVYNFVRKFRVRCTFVH